MLLRKTTKKIRGETYVQSIGFARVPYFIYTENPPTRRRAGGLWYGGCSNLHRESKHEARAGACKCSVEGDIAA